MADVVAFERNRPGYLRQLEQSVIADQIAKLLEQARYIETEQKLTPFEKERMRQLAERAVRSTSDRAVLLASAAANTELRNIADEAECEARREGCQPIVWSALQRMGDWIRRQTADDIFTAYERELDKGTR